MLTLAIILLCVNVVLWVFLFLRLDKRFNAASLLESVREHVNDITLEVNKAADRLLTLADARKTELHELLSQVERKMALATESLDRLEKAESAGYLFPAASRSAPVPAVPPASLTPTASVPPEVTLSSTPIPLNVGGNPPLPLGLVTEHRSVTRQRARSLAATGLSSEAIADTLGLSVTEVELFTL